jgi:hypothetical protein
MERSPPERRVMDLDAGFERVGLVDESEVSLAFLAEEFLEHVAEVEAHLGEGFGKAALGFLVDALDHGEQLGLGVDEIIVLVAEEIVALLEFIVFLDGIDVDGAHGLDLALEVVDEGLDMGPAWLAGDVGERID